MSGEPHANGEELGDEQNQGRFLPSSVPRVVAGRWVDHRSRYEAVEGRGLVSAPLRIFGEHDAATLDQMNSAIEQAGDTVVAAALMADGHLGYYLPIGGVVAYREAVSVTGVGVDIACGNCAYRLDLQATDVRDWHLIGRRIADEIGCGLGQPNPQGPVDHELFGDPRWNLIPGEHRTSIMGRAIKQLGSIGTGNHYVDILEDEDGWVWVGVHFGSRALGYAVSNGFVSTHLGHEWKRNPRWQEAGAALLRLDDPAGSDYMALMGLCGEYAHAGREWVCDYVSRTIIGADVVDTVHNHHNFAWREKHGGESVIVVRKGATPAYPGQRGFVGGSMGDDAVILQGNTSLLSTGVDEAAALYSTVHGAGRVLGRMQAKGKRAKDGTWKRPPMVDRDEVHEWIKRRGVLVYGSDLDESPQAYRRLDKVLAAQGDTIVVEHTLRPRVVVMAGVEDPFLREHE